MAGAGKKTFTAGEILTASDTNTYLMEQTVMNFAGTASRASAIPTPSEGMTSYRQDADIVETFTGSSWLSIGNIKQIVTGTVSGGVTSTTTTFVDTGLTATITPTNVNNKILALVAQSGVGKDINNTSVNLRIVRGATTLTTVANIANTGSGARNIVGQVFMMHLDSPATTSATTYKTQFMSSANNADAYVQYGGGQASVMYLIELQY
jgi:hypothetical protein